MTSLKSHLPALATILGETTATLYERQRVLVSAGLLKSARGHGPGSGPRASLESVTVLLLGMLASASLSEAALSARAIARARPHPGETCSFTGAKTFKDALAAILADETLARRVNEIVVSEGYTVVRYDGAHWKEGPERFAANPPESSIFQGSTAKQRGIRFQASISGDTLVALAKLTPQAGAT